MTVFYFGCWRQPGHYLFTPGFRRPGREIALRPKLFDGIHLDQGFCPPEGTAEGVARLTLVSQGIEPGPATVLAFWDRSGDSRGGSHSTFILPGDLDFGDALDAARDAYPELFDRYPFVVVPWKESA